jgi:hypothetical protein
MNQSIYWTFLDCGCEDIIINAYANLTTSFTRQTKNLTAFLFSTVFVSKQIKISFFGFQEVFKMNKNVVCLLLQLHAQGSMLLYAPGGQWNYHRYGELPALLAWCTGCIL